MLQERERKANLKSQLESIREDLIQYKQAEREKNDRILQMMKSRPEPNPGQGRGLTVIPKIRPSQSKFKLPAPPKGFDPEFLTDTSYFLHNQITNKKLPVHTEAIREALIRTEDVELAPEAIDYDDIFGYKEKYKEFFITERKAIPIQNPSLFKLPFELDDPVI